MEWLYFAGNKWKKVITVKKSISCRFSIKEQTIAIFLGPLFGKRNLENLCCVKIAIRKLRAITENN